MRLHCLTCGKALPTDTDAETHRAATGHRLRSAAHRRKPKAKFGILYRVADKVLAYATTGDRAYQYICAGYRPTISHWVIRKHVLAYSIDNRECTCRQWYATTGIRRPGVDSVLEQSQLTDKRALRTELEKTWEKRARGETYSQPAK